MTAARQEMGIDGSPITAGLDSPQPYSPATGVLRFSNPGVAERDVQVSFVGPTDGVSIKVPPSSGQNNLVTTSMLDSLATLSVAPVYLHPQIMYDSIPGAGHTRFMTETLNGHEAEPGLPTPLLPGFGLAKHVLVAPVGRLSTDPLAVILQRQWPESAEKLPYGTIREVQNSGAVVFYSHADTPEVDGVVVGYPPSETPVALALGVTPDASTHMPRLRVEPIGLHTETDRSAVVDYIGTILVRAAGDGTEIRVFGPDVHLEGHPSVDNTVHHLRVCTGLPPDAAQLYPEPGFREFEVRPVPAMTPDGADEINAVRALAGALPYISADSEASVYSPEQDVQTSSGLPEDTDGLTGSVNGRQTAVETESPQVWANNEPMAEAPSIDISDFPKRAGLGWPKRGN